MAGDADADEDGDVVGDVRKGDTAYRRFTRFMSICIGPVRCFEFERFMTVDELLGAASN